MTPEIDPANMSPREYIVAMCNLVRRIDRFNRRRTACVRMHDLKEDGRRFEFIKGAKFKALAADERERLNRARPIITAVSKKLLQETYGFALARGYEQEFRQCTGMTRQAGPARKPKKIKPGYYATTKDSQSYWKFLQGGAPGLIQQRH